MTMIGYDDDSDTDYLYCDNDDKGDDDYDMYFGRDDTEIADEYASFTYNRPINCLSNKRIH